jgi:hypothetical protein
MCLGFVLQNTKMTFLTTNLKDEGETGFDSSTLVSTKKGHMFEPQENLFSLQYVGQILIFFNNPMARHRVIPVKISLVFNMGFSEIFH